MNLSALVLDRIVHYGIDFPLSFQACLMEMDRKWEKRKATRRITNRTYKELMLQLLRSGMRTLKTHKTIAGD